MQDTENDVRIYELGYWFVPTIPEDGVEAQVTELKSKLSTKGAVIISEEPPYLREIAYEMCKVINNQNNYFNEGYFGWIKFEMDPSQTLALRSELEFDPTIIRSMITQTVRENTVYTKRPATFKKEETEIVTEEVEAVAPVVAAEEVIADTIAEALVTEEVVA